MKSAAEWHLRRNQDAREAFVSLYPCLTGNEVGEGGQGLRRWEEEGKAFSIEWRGERLYPRADADAIHSQIDASLRHQRARAYGWARGTMCLLAYAFVQNAIAVASCRYRLAVARGDTEPEAA